VGSVEKVFKVRDQRSRSLYRNVWTLQRRRHTHRCVALRFTHL